MLPFSADRLPVDRGHLLQAAGEERDPQRDVRAGDVRDGQEELCEAVILLFGGEGREEPQGQRHRHRGAGSEGQYSRTECMGIVICAQTLMKLTVMNNSHQQKLANWMHLFQIFLH